MPFPISLPSYTTPDPNKTLDQDNHTQRHTDEEADIVALAAKVGIDGSAVTSTIDYKLATVIGGLATHIANTSNPHSTTKAQVGLGNADNTSDATKLLAFLQVAYPVGSQYVNFTDSTNPATLFGFGTWTAVTGRVVVGKAASGTFGTAGATGGAETVTLAMSELPVFGHSFSHHGDEGGSVIRSPQATNGTASWLSAPGVYRPPNTDVGGAGSFQSPSWSFGGGGAHNNLQPYTVAYVWQRTA